MTERDDVIVVERNNAGGSHSLGWFLLGAILGAGAALLLAPQAGADTRQALRSRALKVRDLAEEKIQTLRDSLGGDDEEEEEADATGTDVAPVTRRRGRTGAAREELERRLARARARRRADREDDEGDGDDDEEPVA